MSRLGREAVILRRYERGDPNVILLSSGWMVDCSFYNQASGGIFLDGARTSIAGIELKGSA